MKRAIQLARRGFPAPNPHVGCVIAHGDTIVGEGYHHFAGGHHAEVEALLQAGERAQGATAYVTLEPCNHHGRTPPCSEALVKAGVVRVLVANRDPNPKAVGGVQRLLEAGIVVEVGLLATEAQAANDQFLTAMRLKRPVVVLKAGMSLDGRIALPSGESKWITGAEARKQAHRLRAECGAVLVGRRTVEVDDPSLTARIPGVKNQPLRIVLDPGNKLGTHWKVFDAAAPTLHVTDRTLGLVSTPAGFDLLELSEALFNQGVTGLLVEGGGHTIAQFLKAGLVDRIELFVAPKVLGNGPAWVQGLELEGLAFAPHFEVARLKKLKADVQISLRNQLGNSGGVNKDSES